MITATMTFPSYQKRLTGILCITASFLFASCASITSQEDELPDDPRELTPAQVEHITKLYKSPVDSVTVAELSNEFESNSIVAEEKYTGMPVRVTGKIHSVDGDLGGSPVVQIIDQSDEFGFDSISCRNTTRDTAVKLSKGMPITVIGIVDSTELGISMKICQYQDLP